MAQGTVLVVEDDDTIRRLLVDYLQAREHLRVDSARDGIEALHELSIHRYGVVVLDVMMPKMSGFDLLDSLQAMTSDPSVKSLERLPAIIVITSASEGLLPDDTIAQRCPGLVRAVFRKPLTVTRLGETVERFIRQ